MNALLSSMRNAIKGVRYAWATERNLRIHSVFFMLAMIAAVLLNISKVEFLLVLLVSALTFSLELTNTAIERLADKVSPQYDEKIGVVKDVMAGAVLVSSLFSIVVGVIVFFDPILNLLR